MEKVKFEVVDKIAKSGNAYSALQVTMLDVKINDVQLGDIPLSPIFLNPTELAVLRASTILKK